MSEQTVSAQPRRYATRIFCTQNRVPDEPGHPTHRWTTTEFHDAASIVAALVAVLPRHMLVDVHMLIEDHLSADVEAPR